MEAFCYCLDFSILTVGYMSLKPDKKLKESQMSLVEQGKKFSYLAVCVNSMTAHAFACVWTWMLLGVLTTDKRKRTDIG